MSVGPKFVPVYQYGAKLKELCHEIYQKCNQWEPPTNWLKEKNNCSVQKKNGWTNFKKTETDWNCGSWKFIFVVYNVLHSQ